MLVLLFGPPGSGRSTQGGMLENRWGILHLSTSQLLRREMGLGSALGKQAMAYIADGKLVPDDLVYRIVAHHLERTPPGKSIVLNGFPRTVTQLEGFQGFLSEKDLKITHAVELDMPIDELQRRVRGRRVCTQCAYTYHAAYKPPQIENLCDHCSRAVEPRPDDAPEVLAKKLESYGQLRVPLIKRLQKTGVKYAAVDALGAVEIVLRRISEALGLREDLTPEGDPLQKLLSSGILIHCASCKKIVHATHNELEEYAAAEIKVPVSTTLPDQRLFGFVSEKSGKATQVGERRGR
ncbi:MAG: nucleoside monophosphate kinase [Bdellovibrionales bacterium]|nr:nucleoside monophosphate kinase [Bdellovibrionales bacterium]